VLLNLLPPQAEHSRWEEVASESAAVLPYVLLNLLQIVFRAGGTTKIEFDSLLLSFWKKKRVELDEEESPVAKEEFLGKWFRSPGQNPRNTSTPGKGTACMIAC
jgi:hypothetical protein